MVDFVIGGSCWWGFAKEDGKLLYYMLEHSNKRLAERIPYTFSKILGVPFIHASHAGSFRGGILKDIHRLCERKIHGDALILDQSGTAVCKAGRQPGLYYGEVRPDGNRREVTLPKQQYWVLKLPRLLEKGFYMLNEKYAEYYEKITKPELLCVEQKLCCEVSGRGKELG